MHVAICGCNCLCTIIFLLLFFECATSSCNNTLSINIRTDGFPYEISWFLFDGFYNETTYHIYDINNSNSSIEKNNALLDWRLKYDYTQDCALVDDHVCISDGCYSVLMTDGYGDGICCSVGYGYYEISLNNKLLTLADLQYYGGYYTTLYFCTHLFNGGASSTTKQFVFTSEERSKVIIKKNDTIIYYASNFVPFGSPYPIELSADQVSQISIYQGKSNPNGHWSSSQSQWTLIKTFGKNDEIWDFHQLTHLEGV